MGLDIWFAEDIRNALLAANEASASTAAVIAEVGMVMGPQTDDEAKEFFQRAEKISHEEAAELLAISLRAYREGYKAALTTLALAFGLSPAVIDGRHRDVVEAGTVLKIPAQSAALPRSALRGPP